MISRAATILAVAMPLGMCLIVSLAMAVALHFRLARNQRRHQRDSEKAKGRIQELEANIEKLPKLPELYNFEDCGLAMREIQESYQDIYIGQDTAIENYINKWIVYDVKQTPPIPDEISRLEGIFAPEVSEFHSLHPDMDFSFFPNPHHYTAEEMAKHLSTTSRHPMVRHIMVSILLKNTSIRGNRFRTLLPLGAPDILDLFKLSEAARNGLHLNTRLSAHICRFGLYKALKTEPRYYERDTYHEFFEALFQPYFKSNLPDDVVERRADLNEAISAAVAHGMKCLACISQIEYDWGERQDSHVLVPAMVATWFSFGKQYTEVVAERL